MKFKLLLLSAALMMCSWTNAQNLDQSNVGTEDGFAILNSTSGSYFQSFTAGAAGPLEVVEVYLTPQGTGNYSYTMRIRAGDGPSGQILATQNDVYPGLGPNLYPIFFGTPTNVSIGQQYTIEFIVNTPAIDVFWSYKNASYPPGQAWFGAAPQAGLDFLFQTYVSPPNIPETSLRLGYCGNTLAAVNTYLKCYPVAGADLYEFRILNTALVYDETINGSSNNPIITSFAWAPNILGGTAYQVLVRARVGGVWGPYGAPCEVTTPGSATPSTALRAGYCGNTVASPNTTLKCYGVSGATNYEFRFVNAASGFDETVYGSSSNPLLTSFAQLANPPAANTTYDVTVRAFAGGAWGPYGTVCQVSTPANMFTGPVSSLALIVQEARGESRFEQASTPDENTSALQLSVYPNPSNGTEIRVKMDGLLDTKTATVSVYDLTGKMLHAETINGSGNVDQALHLNKALASGMYLLVLHVEEESAVQRLVVR